MNFFRVRRSVWLPRKRMKIRESDVDLGDVVLRFSFVFLFFSDLVRGNLAVAF